MLYSSTSNEPKVKEEYGLGQIKSLKLQLQNLTRPESIASDHESEFDCMPYDERIERPLFHNKYIQHIPPLLPDKSRY